MPLLEKIKLFLQTVAGLLHFLDDPITLHPGVRGVFKPAFAVVFNDGDAATWAEIFFARCGRRLLGPSCDGKCLR